MALTKVQTEMAAGGPAFSAYQSSAQTPSASTFTLVQFQTENFDTASAFNNTGSTVGSAPAYSFNPQVAGYYQINGCVFQNGSVNRLIVTMYKNGGEYCRGYDVNASALAGTVSQVVYLNGSSDYIQIYTYNGSGGVGMSSITQFSASMVRAA